MRAQIAAVVTLYECSLSTIRANSERRSIFYIRGRSSSSLQELCILTLMINSGEIVHSGTSNCDEIWFLGQKIHIFYSLLRTSDRKVTCLPAAMLETVGENNLGVVLKAIYFSVQHWTYSPLMTNYWEVRWAYLAFPICILLSDSSDLRSHKWDITMSTERNKLLRMGSKSKRGVLKTP